LFDRCPLCGVRQFTWLPSNGLPCFRGSAKLPFATGVSNSERRGCDVSLGDVQRMLHLWPSLVEPPHYGRCGYKSGQIIPCLNNSPRW
jgi:hypothetical protein